VSTQYDTLMNQSVIVWFVEAFNRMVLGSSPRVDKKKGGKGPNF